MRFTSFNMMQHSSSMTGHIDSCQYGGLFVVRITGRTEYFKSCTHITRSFTMPIFRHDFIVFITYQGYSSGFIDLTLTIDYECYGYKIAISRAPDCNNILKKWNDRTKDRGTVARQQCTELWLMNGLDYMEPSPFENCFFKLNHSLVPSLASPITIITGTVSSYLSYHVDSDINPFRGDLNVEVNIFKSFYNRSATTKDTFTVPISMQNEYSF